MKQTCILLSIFPSPPVGERGSKIKGFGNGVKNSIAKNRPDTRPMVVYRWCLVVGSGSNVGGQRQYGTGWGCNVAISTYFAPSQTLRHLQTFLPMDTPYYRVT